MRHLSKNVVDHLLVGRPQGGVVLDVVRLQSSTLRGHGDWHPNGVHPGPHLLRAVLDVGVLLPHQLGLLLGRHKLVLNLTWKSNNVCRQNWRTFALLLLSAVI